MRRPKVYVTSKSFGQYSKEALELVKSVAEIDRTHTVGQ